MDIGKTFLRIRRTKSQPLQKLLKTARLPFQNFLQTQRTLPPAPTANRFKHLSAGPNATPGHLLQRTDEEIFTNRQLLTRDQCNAPQIGEPDGGVVIRSQGFVVPGE